MSAPDYEIIIGLEVHVQLQTNSKLFCRCSTQFGSPPNTQTCPVCIGLPGALPVMNEEAMALSLRTAAALNCQIPEFTKWDRKNYYYPDLPKGYQISQFDLPMSSDGYLEIRDLKDAFPPKRVGITRAHLEEDAGKSMHDEDSGRADSRIDLNRTGTPLLEIVSEPDMRSAQEAKAYLTELKLLLTYIGVSDCNMQNGNLRVDGNINLHIPTPEGKIATPIVEVKNVNSFRAVERAMEYEAERQYEAWQEDGLKLGDAPKQTRGWDDQAGVTKPQRQKEELGDYRYFPDPDLVPVTVTAERVQAIRDGLGELPAALRQRLESEYQLSAYAADVMVNQGRDLVDYFFEVVKITGNAKQAGNWIQQDVLRSLNDAEIEIGDFGIGPVTLAELLTAINEGKLDNSRGRDVFAEMLASGSDVNQAMKKLGIEEVDESELVDLCRSLLKDNPQIVADVLAGKHKAVGALIGQAKRQNPNANPGQIQKISIELIQSEFAE